MKSFKDFWSLEGIKIEDKSEKIELGVPWNTQKLADPDRPSGIGRIGSADPDRPIRIGRSGSADRVAQSVSRVDYSGRSTTPTGRIIDRIERIIESLESNKAKYPDFPVLVFRRFFGLQA